MSAQPPVAGIRVLSGMRPTGKLHLGHWRGVLQNWLRMQEDRECFFFVADWHALTTDYAAADKIKKRGIEMAADWLACGIDPARATLFTQSDAPEHAELFVLLSMICPLSWLERIPSYKEAVADARATGGSDLRTYGFLGYPLLQSADILLYRAAEVPVGEDQVAHIEFAREIARRFNFLFGRGDAFDSLLAAAREKIGADAAGRLSSLRERYQSGGDETALADGRRWIDESADIDPPEREALRGDFVGGGREILTEPAARLTATAKMPGLDGRKMSKSYGNEILLSDSSETVFAKLRRMPTDPQRVRRTDPGDPEKCPVWDFHKIFSGPEDRAEVDAGCRSAALGCVDCKRILARNIDSELDPIRARRADLREAEVVAVLRDGAARARRAAGETMERVRAAVGGEARA